LYREETEIYGSEFVECKGSEDGASSFKKRVRKVINKAK
jgi:hypothetical protein